MAQIKANPPDREARVLPFRRPDRTEPGLRGVTISKPAPEIRITGLERYERPDGAEDDYRHRMVVNAAALGVCVLLGAAGVWVAISIADLRRNQDCVLAGRKNCAGLSIRSGPSLIGEERAAPNRFPSEQPDISKPTR